MPLVCWPRQLLRSAPHYLLVCTSLSLRLPRRSRSRGILTVARAPGVPGSASHPTAYLLTAGRTASCPGEGLGHGQQFGSLSRRTALPVHGGAKVSPGLMLYRICLPSGWRLLPLGLAAYRPHHAHDGASREMALVAITLFATHCGFAVSRGQEICHLQHLFSWNALRKVPNDVIDVARQASRISSAYQRRACHPSKKRR